VSPSAQTRRLSSSSQVEPWRSRGSRSGVKGVCVATGSNYVGGSGGAIARVTDADAAGDTTGPDDAGSRKDEGRRARDGFSRATRGKKSSGSSARLSHPYATPGHRFTGTRGAFPSPLAGRAPRPDRRRAFVGQRPKKHGGPAYLGAAAPREPADPGTANAYEACRGTSGVSASRTTRLRLRRPCVPTRSPPISPAFLA
jgi:hypothetical protein